MKRLFNPFVCLAAASIFFIGCASGYRAVNPNELNYTYGNVDNELLIEYNDQTLKGNYAAREIKSGVKLLAVKVVNNTGKTIVFGKDVKVFAAQKEIPFISPDEFYNATDQNPNKSLKFLFLLPLNGYSSSERMDGNRVVSRKFRFYPVGIILAPILAFSNKGIANSANKKYKEDLTQKNILNKSILHGETVYGFVAIEALSVDIKSLLFKTNF